MLKKLIVVGLASVLAVPTYIEAQSRYRSYHYNQSYQPYSQDFRDGIDRRTPLNQCRVRVYHYNFAFPPQGGVIIEGEDGPYFVRTYLPGCENAAAGYQTVRGASTISSHESYMNNYNPPQPQQHYRAPNTGIKERCY